MTTPATLDGLAIRKRLGRQQWGAPSPFGLDGWKFRHISGEGRVIVTVSDLPTDPDNLWIHASISFPDRDPSYEELKLLHAAVFEGKHAYQAFVPEGEWVNIHEHALHLWGRLDGTRMLPNFAPYGSI